jgi:hypothetical protein
MQRLVTNTHDIAAQKKALKIKARAFLAKGKRLAET